MISGKCMSWRSLLPRQEKPNSLDDALRVVPHGWKLVLAQGNPYRLDIAGDYWTVSLTRVVTDAEGKADVREVKAMGKQPTPVVNEAVSLVKLRYGVD